MKKYANPIPISLDIPNRDLTTDQALRKLLAGNYRFVCHRTNNPNQSIDRLNELSNEQNVIRVAGNVVTPSELASIEYGVSILQTKVLMVLGHSLCGAVQAALTGGHLIGHLNTLTDLIQPAIARSSRQPGNVFEAGVRENILLQTDRLRQSSVIAQRLDEKQLKLVGGYFDFKTGDVSILTIMTGVVA
jgi:carbonic anhydrase